MKLVFLKTTGALIASFLCFLAFSAPVRCINDIPENIEICYGQTVQFTVPGPFTATSAGNAACMSGDSLEISGAMSEQSIDIRLFGFLPVKTSKLRVYPQKELYVGGKSIGVALYIRGALVIGSNEVMTENGPYNPAKSAGIKNGDVITAVNGLGVWDSSQLVKMIEKNKDKQMRITVQRKDREETIYLTPVLDANTHTPKIGIWVRDSTAGVGTLTFVDPDTGRFGALGHAICDADTGVMFTVREGEIFDCSIVGVKKGEKGTPGELKGMFGGDSTVLGEIDKNCDYGLFGSAKTCGDSIYGRTVQIARAGAVHDGKATVLCNVDGTMVREYDAVIESVNRLSPGGFKGMIVKITDEELLDKTNGIVQGMSGSPIIQDGRLIGAVTHVFISDPTRGYGLFIDKMIENMNVD